MFRLACTLALFPWVNPLAAALGQVADLPAAQSAVAFKSKTGGMEQMPLGLQFSPDDKVIYARTWYKRTQHSVTALTLAKMTQSSLLITRCPSGDNRSELFAFASDRSFYTISDTLSESALHLITDEGGKLAKQSFKLPWGFISNVQCSLRRVNKGTIRLARITAECDVEMITFDTDKNALGATVDLGQLSKGDRASILYDSGSEIFCSVRRPKIAASNFLSANPSDKDPESKPFLTVNDGCISFQVVDDFYVIGSTTGRISFLPTKGKADPLDAQVLQMCIQQVAVRKEGNGVYTCLVCGADEGNSFAVARVDTKNRTIQSKTFKVASKPAKVLAAFSNDGKSFALIDYSLKLSLYKTEQFKNLE